MPNSQNPGFPRTRRRNPFDGQGCYAPNSSTPPWGWPLTLIIAIAVCGLLFFGPTLAARAIGA
ncbi:Uncharacterised protein [Alcaligenes faecalis]|nr:hypothetical protein AFA2_00767 [Alcaligenes faecalis subsp. faecalis NBRC 13111]CUI53565.1 Uncharacterised protein [Alcaligenes faecalis]